jgi:hypothetical protein
MARTSSNDCFKTQQQVNARDRRRQAHRQKREKIAHGTADLRTLVTTGQLVSATKDQPPPRANQPPRVNQQNKALDLRRQAQRHKRERMARGTADLRTLLGPPVSRFTPFVEVTAAAAAATDVFVPAIATQNSDDVEVLTTTIE